MRRRFGRSLTRSSSSGRRRLPESAELDLTPYEGKAVMVSGRDGGAGWVYSAQVVDEAGPILTAVVYQVFGQTH